MKEIIKLFNYNIPKINLLYLKKMNSEIIETPRFNYKSKKKSKKKLKKTPINNEYENALLYDFFHKKHSQHKHHRSISCSHFIQQKMKYEADLVDKIIIFEFLFKKFKLRNDFDQEHSDIFLKEKEQVFLGYPKTDEIID